MANVKLPEQLRGAKIHFVGIKGTGMAALAEIFFHSGALITGSDVAEIFYTDKILADLGLRPLLFSKSNVASDIDLVVYSSAYSPATNPDLQRATELGIQTMLYTEALGAYSGLFFSAGIAGVHGKTSTTGLAGSILSELDIAAQVLAGSVINSFGGKCTYTSPLFDKPESEPDLSDNAERASKQKFFVAETCEYQRHFMSFAPKIIVLTSVESDHQDCYPTFEDIQAAFVDYICALPQNGTVIFCADDSGALSTVARAKEKRRDIKFIAYGQNASGDYHVRFDKAGGEKNPFCIDCIGEAFLCVPGRHEVLDAAAAVALAFELLCADNKNPSEPRHIEAIKAGLEKFSGGKRRSEVTGRAKNRYGDDIIFIDDYGHHPTAIQTTLRGFREFYSGRKIIVDFMSHTYTRTASLLDEFAKCFSDADTVIINKIYASARESEEAAAVSGKILAERTAEHHRDARHKEEFADAAAEGFSLLDQAAGSDYPNGYLFVTMGAGDNWKVGEMLLEKFLF